MINAERIWNWRRGLSIEPDLNLLYKRPRVDYRISEYVIEYIDKKILKQKNIMQKGRYRICLSMGIREKNEHYYIKDNSYNTETTFFSANCSNRTLGGEKYKDIFLACTSFKLNEKIKPIEYANIIYDMIGVYLIDYYKKINKAEMDTIKNGMDYDFIEQYKYPAPFENQKYVADKSETIKFIKTDGIETETKEIRFKEEYIKYYRE
ncbi:hypothetical protein AGMMS49983_13810 [Clostridia bacterium]|nr:hypothetical protein AGMMS49983_13810 [Clostridia bacterium]